jgi:hypothetical protein
MAPIQIIIIMTSTTVPDIETMSTSFPEEVLPIQDKPDFTSV